MYALLIIFANCNAFSYIFFGPVGVDHIYAHFNLSFLILSFFLASHAMNDFRASFLKIRQRSAKFAIIDTSEFLMLPGNRHQMPAPGVNVCQPHS